MRAAVVAGGRFEIGDLPIPTPSQDEVLVQVRTVGICGSDIHAMQSRLAPQGMVLGHEFTGTVAEVGTGAEGWQQGDRVVANPNADVCGECRYCRAGMVNLCSNVLEKASIGYSRPGAFAEYVVVKARALYRLPASLGFDEGALVEPQAVGLHALHVAELKPGDRALVMGAGPVGLCVIQALRAREAGPVAAVEVVEARRQLASRVGATRVFDGRDVDLLTRLRDEFGDPGLAFDCAGLPQTISTAIQAVRKGGVVVQLALPRRPVAVDVDTLALNEVQLRGSFIYSPEEFQESIDLLSSGTIDVRPLMTRHVTLEELNDAFEALYSGSDEAKILVHP